MKGPLRKNLSRCVFRQRRVEAIAFQCSHLSSRAVAPLSVCSPTLPSKVLSTNQTVQIEGRSDLFSRLPSPWQTKDSLERLSP